MVRELRRQRRSRRPLHLREYDIPFEELRLYDFPDEIVASGTRTVWMSRFFHWDSERHLEIAREHGFRALGHPSEGTYRNYVGIDEKINRVHQYLKVLKFGYGRATDHACEDIRNGRITREQAKELVREHDLEPLSEYYANDLIDFLGMTPAEFDAALESYRDQDIWERGADGAWRIPHHLEEEARAL